MQPQRSNSAPFKVASFVYSYHLCEKLNAHLIPITGNKRQSINHYRLFFLPDGLLQSTSHEKPLYVVDRKILPA